LNAKWFVLFITCLGVLMATIDSNIVVISIPVISRTLPHTSVFDLIWILTGYQLITASVLINFGRLSDMFGRVRLYTYGFGLFTIGSALCSLSQTGLELVIFRIVQAVGAAFLFANSAAILTDAFPVQERGKALGLLQIANVLGSVLGLVLGGILTTLAGWQSIFWVNVPIGVVATGLAYIRLKETSVVEGAQKIDFAGNISFSAGLGSFLAGISLFSIGLISFGALGLLSIVGGALLAIFFRVEKRVVQPMIDLSLFRNLPFTMGNVMIFLNGLVRGSVTLVLSLYLQGPTMRLDSFTAGTFLVPLTASVAIFGPLSGYLSDKYGSYRLPILGMALATVGFVILAQLGYSSTFGSLLVPLAIAGTGFGIFAAPNRASIMNSVGPQARGVASAASTTFISVGATLSQGIVFLVMALIIPIQDVQKVMFGSSGAIQQSGWIDGFIASIHYIFILSAVVMVFGIAFSLAVKERRSPPSSVLDV
jgi:EmrB/QacA subfamily drug resistance transporter